LLGWRARIGAVIAHSNTTLEPEFSAFAPAGVSVHASRIHLGSISVSDMAAAAKNSEQAVTLLSDIGARAIAYACNGASVAGEASDEDQQERRIGELAGAPAVLATRAVAEALSAIGARRIAVATPYPADLNEKNNTYWRASGFEIVRTGGVELGSSRRPAPPFFDRPVSAVGLQEPGFSYHLARSVAAEGVDAVIVLGCNLRTFEAADPFERDCKIPFISSNIALLWACLQIAGIKDSIAGCGMLLREQPHLGYQWMARP